MKRTLSLHLHVILLIAATAVLRGGEADPRRHINCFGYGILSTELGSITDGKMALPLKLSYSSGRDRGTLLPPQWEIPLLESRVVAVDEDTVEVVLPDASSMILEIAKDTGVITPSMPGTKVESKGNRLTLLKSGHRYEFDKGRLKEHEMPG